jgi:hypothetical protein
MDCAYHSGVDAPYQCYRCRKPICVDCESKRDGMSICLYCVAEIRQHIEAQYEAETRAVNYPGAVVNGSLVALGMGCIWSQLAVWSESGFSVGAVVLGGIVGYAVKWGAGQKRSPGLQQMASILALVGLVVANFLILLRTGGGSAVGAPSFDSAFLAALYAFPAYLSSLGLLNWLFWVLGVAIAYWVPHVRYLPKQSSKTSS